MKWPGFIGPTYQPSAYSLECQLTKNWHTERVESGAGKSPYGLLRTPGRSLFCDPTSVTGVARVRGVSSMNGRLHWVVGQRVVEVFANGTYNVLAGAVLDDGLPARMAQNTSQLFIVSGGSGYIVDLTTNTLTQIGGDFPTGRARGAAEIDGYFATGLVGSQQFQISDLNMGLVWDGDMKSSAEEKPDFVEQLGVINKELWPFGNQTVQVFVDTGDPDFPFEPRLDVSIDLGLWAPESLTDVAGAWFFVAGSSRGAGMVMRMSGYAPSRISNFSVENTLRELGNPQDWVGWTYEENGHAFYVIYSPSKDRTLCYDLSVDQWHERTYFANGAETAHRGYCAAQAFGKILVGDRLNGKIYEQSMNYLDDGDGALIRRTRRSPCINEELLGIVHGNFVLDGNMGIGLGGAENADPQAMLRFSNDGGKTWSNEKWRGFGRQGEYNRRAMWRSLGYARRRVYELVVTDPVDWAISACNINMKFGRS